MKKRKPSDVLLFGITALRQWESEFGTVVRMGCFRDHVDGKPAACIGGAARVVECKWSPYTMPPQTQLPANHIEHALNNARIGYVGHMFRCLEADYKLGVQFDRRITDYIVHSGVPFYRDMYNLHLDMVSNGF